MKLPDSPKSNYLCLTCDAPVARQSRYCRQHWFAHAVYKTKTCEHCGADFAPNSGRQLRCETCKANWRRDQHAAGVPGGSETAGENPVRQLSEGEK